MQVGRCGFIILYVEMVKRDMILILFQFLHLRWFDTPGKHKINLKINKSHLKFQERNNAIGMLQATFTNDFIVLLAHTVVK